jgi:capsular polysaccharide transport system permease protein
MQEVLTLQVRVLGALVLRETRATFGTTQIGYLWAIITPAAQIAVLVAVFTAIDRQPPFGASLALFFSTGILTIQLFMKLGNSLMTVFDANKALLTYPPIKETDVLFARAILICATYVVIMLVFFSGLVFMGYAEPPAAPEHVMMAFAATSLLGFGFGATNAAIFSVWESWRNVEKILTRPLLFVSGVFYVPSHLPPNIVAWLEWNPLLHCIEWMRNGFYPNYDSAVIDIGYLMWCALGLTLFGLAGERLTRYRRSSA